MCGILGYCAQEWDPALAKFFGLQGFNLQHRGQENFGCTYSNGKIFNHFKDKGLVSQVFTRERRDEFDRVEPLIAIGQTRYATAGGTDAISAQPHWMTLLDGFYSNATNGDLPLLEKEINELRESGTILLSGNDGEVILKKILQAARTRNGGDIVAGIKHLMETTPGAYSGCLMSLDHLYLYRDPHGFRPLYYGRWRNAYVFASESCAFHERDAEIEREVYPGEVIVFDTKGHKSHHQVVEPKHSRQKCIFEPIYFARPDSQVYETPREVGSFRYQLGKQLAREKPVEDAIVIPVPDSGRFSAVGYATEIGLPLRELFVRNPYIPRTFQIAGQANREDLVRLKFTVMMSLIERYRKFVIIDDSLVRSTTMRILIAMIRESAEKCGVPKSDVEVHIRLASPPIKGCCYYGIDTPESKELAAANMTIDEIAKEINATSVAYISLEGLDEVAGKYDDPGNFCHACFTAVYPTPYQVRTR
ncbi:MAG: amidophosphoribosyltransferase [Candidatus Latescibacterota bacterium]|nr:MAG: amidophosphoribosyltransferase [Candidatus Latescibacterota bacterium]